MPYVKHRSIFHTYFIKDKGERAVRAIQEMKRKDTIIQGDRSPKGKITCNGITKSLSEWEKETGIPENLITTRIYGKKWDVERALTEPPKKRKKNKTGKNEVLITCDGETHNILEWSRITGISRHTISARLGYGWAPEKALKKPVRGYKMHSGSGDRG